MLVGWAFAIAAASYFPLLLLGAWWRGLTATGAASGMLVGGLASLTAIIAFMLSERKVFTIVDPLFKSLCEQPAIWAVPLSLGVMYVVSRVTKASIPADVDEKMLRLHAPEGLGYSKDYIASDH
jgi:Na+(H+)/acetate symporter ActP